MPTQSQSEAITGKLAFTLVDLLVAANLQFKVRKCVIVRRGCTSSRVTWIHR